MLEKTCIEYLNELASSAPVPGGGSVSGLTGALGTALAEMALNLSAGKKSVADREQLAALLRAKLPKYRARFSALSEMDAEGFKALSAVYGIKAETEAEKEEKEARLEDALRRSAEAPCGILSLTADLSEELGGICACATKTMKSDVYCAVSLCAATAECACINILANTRLMKDREYAERLGKESLKRKSTVVTECRKIMEEIEEMFV